MKIQNQEVEIQDEYLPLIRCLLLFGFEILSVENDPLEIKVRINQGYTGSFRPKPVKRLHGWKLWMVNWILKTILGE